MVLTIVAVTVMFVALPVRSYLQQGSDVEAARRDLQAIQRDNAELRKRRDRMSDPGQIERIARSDYGLVDVGEESYSVLPPSSAGLVMPRAWPFDRIEQAVRTASGD